MVRFALGAMMPRTEALPGVADLELDPFVDRFWVDASWLFWIGAVGSCFAFMMSPLLTIYVPLPAALLSQSQLDRHAMEMASHNLYVIRQAGMMVKMLAGLHWAATARVRREFGLLPYPPDPETWRTS